MTSPMDFPPPRDLPKEPPFGWILNPLRLTVNEAAEVAQQCGVHPMDMEGVSGRDAIRVGMYVAMAYARRLDPDAYPWTAAENIPIDQLKKRFPGEDQDDAAVAKAVEAAIESGESAPDPS